MSARKPYNFKHTTTCDFCGDQIIKKSWKQRYCSTCCPNPTARQRIDRYGIANPAFEAMFEAQNGKCLLCPALLHFEHINGMHIDHDHVTSEVRGLLCGTCNVSIGYIERFIALGIIDDVLQHILKRAA